MEGIAHSGSAQLVEASDPSSAGNTDGLEAADLRVAFGRGSASRLVVGGLSLSARRGCITGVAGESGSGKTTAALAAIGYLPGGATLVGGESRLGGDQLLGLDGARLRDTWAKRVGYVSQNAATALNPVKTIGWHLGQVLSMSRGLRGAGAKDVAVELLDAVRLPEPEVVWSKYPHQMSGGQLQRAAIAIALARQPEALILDEPTTGLDVTTQDEIVRMLTARIREEGIAALFISHDLALLTSIADELVVMYAGEAAESGPVREIVHAPRHPYTRALLDSLLAVTVPVRPDVLRGLPPGRFVGGTCAFAPRCRWKQDKCVETHPPLTRVDGERAVRCLRTAELGVLHSTRKITTSPAHRLSEKGSALLDAEDLVCIYQSHGGEATRAVDDVSFHIEPEEIVALVGESGSGKSTIARAIAGVLQPDAGALRFQGAELAPVVADRPAAERRDIQLIFQNADSSLNPRHSIGTSIERSVTLFRDDVPREERAKEVGNALLEVQLDPELARRYPHQLSGGQKQRAAIARAFVARPRLVICDEIVSGQDVSVQAALLELIRRIQQERRTALLFITHDLAVVRSLAQYVYVMRNGRIEEQGKPETLLSSPASAYTRRLLDAARGVEAPVERTDGS